MKAVWTYLFCRRQDQETWLSSHQEAIDSTILKNFKTCLIGDKKRRYSVWPYTKMVAFHNNADAFHTECITAVWEQIYLYLHY